MNLTNRRFHLWDGVLIPLRYAPVHMVLILLQRLISALLPALNVGITASFVDTAILVGSGAEPLSAITVPLSLIHIFPARSRGSWTAMPSPCCR